MNGAQGYIAFNSEKPRLTKRKKSKIQGGKGYILVNAERVQHSERGCPTFPIPAHRHASRQDCNVLSTFVAPTREENLPWQGAVKPPTTLSRYKQEVPRYTLENALENEQVVQNKTSEADTKISRVHTIAATSKTKRASVKDAHVSSLASSSPPPPTGIPTAPMYHRCGSN